MTYIFKDLNFIYVSVTDDVISAREKVIESIKDTLRKD